MTSSSAVADSIRERTVEIGDRRHRVVERPAGDSTTQTIIALHGANVHAGLFGPLFCLMDSSFALYAPDQPGRGLTEDLTIGTISERVEFLEAAIGALGLERPIVLGHSLGAAIALELALKSPHRIGGVILCSGGFRFEIARATLDELRELAATGGRRRPGSASFSRASLPDVGWVADLYRAVPAAAALADYQALVEWSAEHRFRDVTCPALIIRGQDEFPILESQCAIMASAIPGAKSVVIPNAGHLLPAERPEPLAAAIQEFARSLKDPRCAST